MNKKNKLFLLFLTREQTVFILISLGSRYTYIHTFAQSLSTFEILMTRVAGGTN